MSAPRILSPTTTSGGTPVGGSGTTNTIPRWTGPSTLGDSGLIDDGSKIYATLRKFATGTHLGTAQLESRAAASDTVLRANAQAGFGDWQILGAGIVGQQLLSAPYAFVWQACNPANTAQFPISLNPNGGNVGIGTASPTARLDVSFGAVGLVVGADNSATTRTDNTAKYFRMASYPYTNANRPNGMFTVDNTLTENVLGLGGGSSLVNAATRISFFTGATTNTQTGTEAVRITSTAIDASLTSGYGLKLPATPGNADTQTLDCYQEGTWAPTLAGFGGTNPTVTATLTRVGRLVTLTVQMQSTGGAQYSGTLGATTLTVPAGMTPNIPACTNLVDGAVQNLGNVAAYNDGLIYLPTFALTTAFTFFVVTYRV